MSDMANTRDSGPDVTDVTDDTGTTPGGSAGAHAVVLHVAPREVLEGTVYEASYRFEVTHPATCPASEERCAVADLELNYGSEKLREGFGAPEPDQLSDAELAALDGTVRFLNVRRTTQSHSTLEGTEYNVHYELTWDDAPTVLEG